MKEFIRPLRDPSSILVRDAKFLLTEGGVTANKSLLVRDRRIEAIGDSASLQSRYGYAERVIDASRSIVIPGLINNHSHIAMSILRGYAEDLPLLSWLKEKVWPAEAKLTPFDMYLGAVAGCAEALLSGTTSLTSVYFYDQSGSEAEAAYDTGIRGVFAHGIFDWTRESGRKRTEEMVSSFHGRDDGRIRIATSPHAPYSCSPELLKEIESLRGDLNEKYGKTYRILNTLHVAEARTEAEEIQAKYGVQAKEGVAKYLDSLGVLNDETICAHCIHLTEGDLAAFRRSGASIASCPVSNLKVGMGIADLPRMISNGTTVSLGTDGPASNNSLDMFETLKMSSLLSKGLKGDTTLMDARLCFEIATIGGARSLHQEKDVGGIAVGKRADIVILDVSHIHAAPLYDPYSHIAYSSSSHDVSHVVVDGRLLVDNREISSIDVPMLREALERRTEELGFAPKKG